MDGWRIEGWVEGVTGWSIGNSWKSESDPSREIAALYNKPETVILSYFCQEPESYAAVI